MMILRCRSALAPMRFLIALCLCAPDVAAAQKPLPPTALPAGHPPQKPVARAAKASKSANVRRGNIVAIDAALGKLTLKSAAGVVADYELTDKTHYWKARHAAAAAAFAPGDAVVVHLRHSRKTDKFQVIELDDRSSWDWLTALRHRTLPATITALDDDTLSVTLAPDHLPFTYVLSQDTLWSRGDKTVQPAAFKAGDTVYVVPRALPGGDVQAHAVSDSTASAALLKERASTSLHGVIHALDAAAHTLTLTTSSHDIRALACDPELEIVRGGKTLSWGALKVGQSITARLHRNAREEDMREGNGKEENGTEEAVKDKAVIWRITIQAARAKSVKTGARKRAKR